MKLALSQIQNPKIPSVLREALKADSKARETWDDISVKAKRDWILWIITTKKEETKIKRINQAITNLASGKHRVCCFGGANWLIKNKIVTLV